MFHGVYTTSSEKFASLLEAHQTSHLDPDPERVRAHRHP